MTMPGSADHVHQGRPAFIAHFVIRTKRFEETVAWHKLFFEAEVVYEQQGVVFLSYDDEHHRVAIAEMPELEDFADSIAGIDHLAFSMSSVDDFVTAYERNRSVGIMPFWSINHGPTTSIYYRDPNQIKIELQVDNTPYPGGPAGFFKSDAFARNPLGVEFDPDEFAARYHAGESLESLLERVEPTGHG